MNYRRLGNAGVKVSEIGLGGWLTFGGAMDDAVADRVMGRALEVGINFLDSAYARGACEACWGRLLKGRRRSAVVLATKVFFGMDDGPNDKGLSRKHIMEQCDASLGRFQTDYIDLYQCHRYDPETPLEETVRAMDDLVRRGKILYWGFSQWPVEVIAEALQLCERRGYSRPVSSQPDYNAISRWIEGAVMPLCHRNGIGQVVYSPLAQGILSGKYKPGEKLPEGSRATDDRQNMFMKGLISDQKLLERVQRLVPLAKEAGLSMSQLALAWVLRRPEVSSAIIGASRPEQVEENAKASGVKLSDEAIKRVDELMKP
jgi:voltage-dependent potassium channel beta subunit